MNIAKYFAKTPKSSGQGKPDAAKEDAAGKQKQLGSQQQTSSDNDTRVKKDRCSPKDSSSPVEDMDTDQVQKRGAGGASSSTPLSETTNKQAAAAAAAAGAGSKEAAPASPAKQQQQGGTTADVPTIDLSSDSPQPAARTASEAADPSEKQQEDHAAARAATPGNMDVDAAPSAAAAGSAGAGAAGAAAPGQPGAGPEPATPAAAKLIAGSVPGSAANTSTAKVPAEAFLTPEKRKQLLEACEKELPLLEAELDVRPDLSGGVAAAQGSGEGGKKGQALDLKHQVSLLVEGQSMPLTQLAQHISSMLSRSGSGGVAGSSGGDDGSSAAAAAAAAAAAGDAGAAGSGAVSALVVRNIIQDVASRKSYGLQDGALANVDALEDATPAYHWCWELRSLTGLPKPIKQQADQARKHRKQVLDRLKAASAYASLARSFTKSTKTAEAKLARAAGKLEKLPGLDALQGAAAAAAATAAAATAATAAEAAAAARQKGSVAAAKAERVRAAEADKAAKEAEKAAKEEERVAKEADKAARAAAKAAEAEEKARAKAEEAEKREAARAVKAAEAAKKAAETAKKKQAAAAAKNGFHSTKEMARAQNMFASFLGKAAARTPTPAGPSGDTSQGTGSQHEGVGQQGAPATATKECHRVWALPGVGPSQQQVFLMQQLDQELPYLAAAGQDGAAAGSGGSSSSAATSVAAAAAALRSVPELLSALQQHWRSGRNKHIRVWGLPPSFAQRPGAASDPDLIRRTADALYGEGVELSGLRCFRRKLIKHHDSVRPPFYGSNMAQTRCVLSARCVRPRRPLGTDRDLDYEVMSDQDWEEEPEGESLSVDGDDDEDAAGDDGDEDEEGFVVGDGYLSEDEGLRDGEEDEGGGNTASPLPRCQSADAADAADAAAAGGAAGPEQAALAQLEAGLERARARGRPLVLVHNCPEMNWEPTSNIDPSLLSSLRGTIMRPDVVVGPPTPGQLPHLFGTRPPSAAAASPTAAAAHGAAAAGAGPNAPGAAAAAAAAAAGGDAAAGAGGGQRGRPAAVFPDSLLPALVQHVQQHSTLAMDKLVVQFVDAQAALGVKVAKARVKDKIKQITTMRMVAKAPLYTVKPEYCQAAGAGAAPGAAAAAAAADDAGVGGDAMQVDEVPQPAGEQQQQQQQGGTSASVAGAGPAATTGVKRAAPAADAAAAAAAGAHSAAGDKVQPGAAAGAASGPPAKKQKTPAGGGIERFLGLTKPKQQQQQPVSVQGNQQPQEQQQQQLQTETPPSTPRHQRVDARVGSPAGQAGEAAAAGAAAGAAGNTTVNGSGVLPMLTPPSDAAADRPLKSHSPVPFRMNGSEAAAEAATAEGNTAAAAAPIERPPVNRWHAQADCRGMGLQGGNTGSVQQQQQASQQPFAGFDQQQQQPGNGGSVSAAAAAGAAAVARAAAAAGRGSDGGASGGCKGGASARKVPQLPEDGTPPDSSFWRQLASWIIGVREPSHDDIDCAFRVFDEQHLVPCIHDMPQDVLSAMMKTLGSERQSLEMRAACARCIANTAVCLARPLKQQQQQHQQHHGAAAGAAAAPAATPPRASAAAAAAPAGPTPAAASPSCGISRRGPSCSPSPSSSPRSAPVEVSFEELCVEPGLLDNLLRCMNPDKVLAAARAAAGPGGSSSSSVPTLEQAVDLSKNATRAMATLLRVGIPTPVGVPVEVCPSAAAAAAQLRVKVASIANWRGALRMAARQNDDRARSTYGLMGLHALLSDPAAASQLLSNERLAKGLLRLLVDRASSTQHWVIQKWCLLVISVMLSEESFQALALPQQALGRSLGTGSAEDMAMLEGLGGLLGVCIAHTCRPAGDLSGPGADRVLLQKSLTLTNLLVGVLGNQQQLHGGRLPRRLAVILGGAAGPERFAGVGQEEGDSALMTALQEIAMQDEWEEAAERARHIIDAISSTAEAAAATAQTGCDTDAGGDTEMRDM